MTETAVLEDFLKLIVAIPDWRLFIYTNALISSEFGKIHPVELRKRICPLSRGFRYLAVGFPAVVKVHSKLTPGWHNGIRLSLTSHGAAERVRKTASCPELTDSDYDALFAAMKDHMPRMWREIFPKILAQLEGTGVLTVTVTDTASRLLNPA